MLAPARATGYLEAKTTKNGRNVVVVETSDSGKVEADAVVLATGYKSSWAPLFDGTFAISSWVFNGGCLTAL